MHHTPFSKQVASYLEGNLPAYLDLLKRMVAINSFTSNPAGVNTLAEVTAAAFAKLGFTAEPIRSANPNYGNHLILTRTGQSGRRIGLVSHLDTVFPPAEEAQNDFAWRVEGDRIYGPGTVDIKGGTVLIYMMLDALQTYQPQIYDDITWVILLDASEEADADDFGQLCIERLAAPQTVCCLVFEGGYIEDDKFWVVVARKGMAVFNVTVVGRAAHAGTSHQNGANAIVQMAHTIRRLAAITDYRQNVTVNVGIVAGGTVTNRVPHYATAALEMRAFTPDVYDTAVAQILSLNDHAVVNSESSDFACQVQIALTRKTQPWSRNKETDRLFAVWQEAAAAFGYRLLPEERGGLSDGNHFWDQIPTLDGLGPSGANAHCSERSADGRKDQEYVLVSSFVPKTLLNLTAVLKLVEIGD